MLTTNAPTSRVDRNCTESGGKSAQPGFSLVGEFAQAPHYPETRASPGGYRIGSLGIRSSRMPTRPIAPARDSVATGASG